MLLYIHLKKDAGAQKERDVDTGPKDISPKSSCPALEHEMRF